MSSLRKSFEPCGEWIWFLEDEFPAELESAIQVAKNVVPILEKWRLLRLEAIEYPWIQLSRGDIGIYTKIPVDQSMEKEEIIANIRASRPAGHPEAVIDDLIFSGSGVWFDAEGAEREEPDLIQLTVTSAITGVTLTLEVHHDIWSRYDFSGKLQEGIYSQNAPRLAAALREIDASLPVSVENGERTYFGRADGYEVFVADSAVSAEPYSVEDRL